MAGGIFSRDLNLPPIRSVDQALRELYLANLPVKFPSAVRQLIGNENIASIQKLLASPEVVELDALFMAGHLSDDQTIAFVRTLPELVDVRRTIYLISQRIGDSLLFAFANTLKKDLHLYGEILKRFFSFFEDLFLEGRPTFRNGRLDELRKMAVERFAVLSVQYLKSTNSNLLGDITSFWESFQKRDLNLTNISNLIAQIDIGKDVFRPRACAAASDAFANKEDLTLLPYMLDELVRLTETHVIKDETFRHGDFIITLFQPTDDECQALRFCDVRIVLPTASRPLMCVFDRGNSQFIMSAATSSLGLFLDPHMQEVLTYVVVDHLLQQLYVMENARLKSVYESLAAYHEMRAAQKAQKEQDITSTGKTSTDDGDLISVPDMSAYVRYHVSQTVPNSVSDSNTCPVRSAEDMQSRVSFLQCLPSLSGRDIIDAFARLVGDPVRQNGSHVIFRFRGKTYPIPLHSGQAPHPGIVLRGMKTFGITSKQMLEALE